MLPDENRTPPYGTEVGIFRKGHCCTYLQKVLLRFMKFSSTIVGVTTYWDVYHKSARQQTVDQNFPSS